MSYRWRTIGMAAGCLVLAIASAATAQTGDFRVDTSIHVGAEQRKVLENRVLFVRDRVYDISLTTGEISILDLNNHRFILVDPQRQLKTSVDTVEIHGATKTILERIREQRGPDFAAKFAVSEEDGWIVVADQALTYKAKGESPDAESPAAASAAGRYQHFADWYARINAMRGGAPPFTRMELNQQLARRNLLPAVITRTIGSGRTAQTVEARHVAIWLLSTEDRQRIERVGEYLARFESVGPEVYFTRNESVAAKE